MLLAKVASGNASERFDEQENLKDETSKELIVQLLKKLGAKARSGRIPAGAAT